ncbi:MAG: hypothetical protein Q8J96_00815 [Rhodocyclaceae bacterium]|nr:hypothetical protein [Rhodocyclaceae bacterium]
MKRTLLFLLVAGTLAPAWAQHEHHAAAPAGAGAPATESRRPPADRAWTQQPLLLPGRNPRGERAQALLQPRGITAETVTVFAAEGPAERRKVAYPVSPEGVKIAPATPQIGNYHWVVAREETPGAVKVASTAWYFGNPGDSPKELLKAPKHELEIVPDPLPREHGRYRESEKWRFLVRFNGQPLASQPLTLETEFGSRNSFVTDAAGFATVLFPRDFKPAKEDGEHAGHGRRYGKFVLSAEKDADGKRYLTAFNLSYGEDGDRNRSLGWGAAFGLIGMLAATPLLRRRNGAQGESKNA